MDKTSFGKEAGHAEKHEKKRRTLSLFGWKEKGEHNDEEDHRTTDTYSDGKNR